MREGGAAGPGREPSVWLVPVQAAALLGLVLPGGPVRRLPGPVRVAGAGAVGLGAVLAAAAGLRLGGDLTPAVTPRAGAPLRTDGVYAWSRHPLYGGLLLLGGGTVLLRGRATSLVAAAVLAGVLHLKVGAEEQVLAQRFGPAWQEYTTRVPRLVGLRRGRS